MTWIIPAILSAVFAALVAIFGKIGLSQIDATLATTIRTFVMALFFFVVSLVLGKFPLLVSFDRKILIYVVLSGLAGAISWLFYFWALKYGPASGVAALDRLSVVFVLVLAVLFLGEHLTWRSGFGAALMAAGAILMVFK